MSENSERLDLQLTSANLDSELNESTSSKSNQGDTTDNTNLDSSHPVMNTRSIAATPALVTTNTSRTSVSTNAGLSTGRAFSRPLTSIMERQRSPDVLLKKWIKNQKITAKNPEESIPLSVSEYFLDENFWPNIQDNQIRLLHVGDTDDLNRIFGLENTTDVNKEQIRERQSRETEPKLLANVKRRPATSVG
jgi:hypothetical protein